MNPQIAEYLSQRFLTPRSVSWPRSPTKTLAAQHQCLIDSVLELGMQGFDIAIFVRLTSLNLLHRQAVVLHQAFVALREVLLFIEVVDGSTKAIRSVAARNAT